MISKKDFQFFFKRKKSCGSINYVFYPTKQHGEIFCFVRNDETWFFYHHPVQEEEEEEEEQGVLSQD
jgi:hypothetical protein